jgi:hypothetical protein
MMEVELYVQTKLNELETPNESRRVSLLMEAARHQEHERRERRLLSRRGRVRRALATPVVAAGAGIERLGLWIAMEPRAQE